MLIAVVEGTAVAANKHPSLHAWKLLIVQPIDLGGQPDGDPVLAMDPLGAGHGDKVLISSDGKGTRELLGSDTSPARWAVIGLVD